MDLIGVIPARLGSTRLERKPLRTLQNKAIILWVCEAVQRCKSLDDFFVATDSEEIQKVVQNAGFQAIMTDQDCASGTDRVWQVAQKFKPKYIINIQGDEPLVEPQAIDDLAQTIVSKKEDCWVTLGGELNEASLKDLNSVKVVFNSLNQALYFSRWPIPFSRQSFQENHPRVLKHIGLYAYTYQALKDFCETPPSEIEKAESLEQLRALDMAYKIYVVRTKYHAQGVDTLEDLKNLEKYLGAKKS